jgi:hypothetical protein
VFTEPLASKVGERGTQQGHLISLLSFFLNKYIKKNETNVVIIKVLVVKFLIQSTHYGDKCMPSKNNINPLI